MDHDDNKPAVFGVLAQFGDSDSLIKAARTARAAGYTRMDGHSPIPVHGLYEALGYKRSILAWIVGCGAIAGFCSAVVLQVFCSAVDGGAFGIDGYPLMVGGRPFISWPSFIPICFELTILFSAFSAVFGMIGLNGLPMPYHPTFNAEGFDRATLDKYFLCIESDDPHFDEADVTAFLGTLHPENVVPVPW